MAPLNRSIFSLRFNFWRSSSESIALSPAFDSRVAFLTSSSCFFKKPISFRYCFKSASSERTSFNSGLLVIFLALLANLSVENDSSIKRVVGVIVQMIAVLAFPPRAGCKIRVSLESLYAGAISKFCQCLILRICRLWVSWLSKAYLSPPSESFAITVLRDNKLLLIFPASFRRNPSAPV